MRMYKVGPNSLDRSDKANLAAYCKYKYVIYYYEARAYGGSGLALAVTEEGGVDEYNLGHCSCYGPSESAPASSHLLKNALKLDKWDEAFPKRKRSPEDNDYVMWQAVVKKLKQIVAAENQSRPHKPRRT